MLRKMEAPKNTKDLLARQMRMSMNINKER